MSDLVETSLRQILSITSRDCDSLRQAHADMATIHGIADLALTQRTAPTPPTQQQIAEALQSVLARYNIRPHGCVCPAGSEASCKGNLCPRRRRQDLA